MNDEALAVYHIDHLNAASRARTRRANLADMDIDSNEVQACLMSRMLQQYNLPADLFYCIPESARLEFICNRKQLLDKGKRDQNAHGDRGNSKQEK